MQQEPLHRRVKIQKASQCSTCKSYIYTLPCNVDRALADSLLVFGEHLYPLDKFKVLSISTKSIDIKSKLEQATIDVKYLSDYENMSSLFRTILEQWLNTKEKQTNTTT